MNNDLRKSAEECLHALKMATDAWGANKFPSVFIARCQRNLQAALAEQDTPAAEVHEAHLRPADNGGHWCREVLLYSGGNPGDQLANGPRVKLYIHPQQKAEPAAYVTEEMVEAYLTANDAYWRRIDAAPGKIGKWRNGTPSEATRISLMAALAAQPQQAPAHRAPYEIPR